MSLLFDITEEPLPYVMYKRVLVINALWLLVLHCIYDAKPSTDSVVTGKAAGILLLSISRFQVNIIDHKEHHSTWPT